MSTLNFGPGDRGPVSHSDDLKLCPHRGCDELIPATARGCELHKNETSKSEYAMYRRYLRSQIYKDKRWHAARTFVKIRDNFTCQNPKCRRFDPTGRSLVVDHMNEGGVLEAENPFDPAILQTLCNVCSGKKDGSRGSRKF